MKLSKTSEKAAKQANQVIYDQNRNCQIKCEDALNRLANGLFYLMRARATLKTEKDPAIAVGDLCNVRDQCAEVARSLHEVMRPIEIRD
ncbi:hypothetical protein M0R72_16230 [Candidatus Pacearchaeota archaeon]|jgi:hypothetical protein|nr:hypothetical protein [Candidatus Pacearchaeota archaeon]